MHKIIEQNHPAILSLCQKYDVHTLALFGSALRDDFNDTSDLDFVVDFQNFTPANAADRFLGLMIDLEDLFHRKIDLVSYRVIRNPYFKQIVDQTRVNLYAA